MKRRSLLIIAETSPELWDEVRRLIAEGNYVTVRLRPLGKCSTWNNALTY